MPDFPNSVANKDTFKKALENVEYSDLFIESKDDTKPHTMSYD